MEDYAGKWDRLKKMIKKKGRIEDWDHRLWIEPLQVERVEGNTLIVYCKSSPHLNYLKKNYLDLINDTLKKVGLNGYEVRLMLPAEDKPYVFFKDNEKKEKQPYKGMDMGKYLREKYDEVSDEIGKCDGISDETRRWLAMCDVYLEDIHIKEIGDDARQYLKKSKNFDEIERIMDIVADHFGVSSFELEMDKQESYMIAVYIAAEMTDCSLDEISRFFEGDIYKAKRMIRKVEDYLYNGDKTGWKINELMKRLSEMSFT